MQAREKRLLILLAASIGIGLILNTGTWYERVFSGPVKELENQSADLDVDLTAREQRLNDILAAKQRLNDWREHSFPPDIRDAQRLYQKWMTDLAVSCGFSETTVAPIVTSRSAVKSYAPVRVSLKAKATLEQLGTFLDRFRRTDLLHRISELNVERETGPADPKLTISLTAEGLSLPGASERQHLFARTELAQELTQAESRMKVVSADGFPASAPFRIRIANEVLVVTDRSDVDWTVTRGADKSTAAEHASGTEVEHVPLRDADGTAASRNAAVLLAGNPFRKPDQIATATETAPPDDSAKSVRLVGYFAEGSDERALLFDSSTNTQTVLRVGTKFSVGKIRGVVVDIERTFVMLRIGDDTFRLNSGDSLSAMQNVPSPPDNGTAPAEAGQAVQPVPTGDNGGSSL